MRVLIPLLIGAAAVWAQDSGRISGLVTDPSGAAVPKATVNLFLHGGTAAVATTQTNSQGIFTLETLRPLYFDLVVEASGFQQLKLENLKVDPSRTYDVPTIKLDLATAATTVDVTAGIEAVQTTSPAISTTVTAAQIERLPVSDRNVLALVSTQAAVAPTQYETVLNGQRSSFTNITVNGINVQDNYIRTGGVDYLPNQLLLDQTQEFTVITSNQGADSGGGASQINFVTPSGTNQFHGSAFWQNRNNALAANSWFNNQDGIHPPRLNLNIGGVSVGGPIKHDRLFFFTTYEISRLRNEESENSVILTQDARNGIFTYQDTRGQIQKANILKIVDLQQDPTMAKLLAQVPGPDKINNFRVGNSQPGKLLDTAGYSFLARNNRDRDNAQGSLDYYLSARNAINATFAWNRDTVDRPDVGLGYNPVSPFTNDDSRKLVSLSWRWNPGPNLTNQVLAGFNFAPATFGYNGTLPPYLIGRTIYSTPDPASSASVLTQGRNTRTFAAADNASWIRGRHTLKFGYQFQGIRVRTYDYTGTIPTYNVGINSAAQSNNLLFPSDLPRISATDLNIANELLATLTGLLDTASVTYNVTGPSSGFVPAAPYLRHFIFDNHAFYGQDNWKVRRNLTFTAALRWDYWSPVNERDSLELQPLLTKGSARDTLLSDGTLYYSGKSAGRPFYKKDLNNFGPSAGLAWDVFGNGKTSLRAGYGINFVNDEGISVAEGFTAVNEGLQRFITRSDLSGTVTTGRPNLPAPDFQVPLTFLDDYLENPFASFALLDPALRTPYVQQWNFSIQHEIKGTIVEARYVGNHATKLLRGFDYNQETLPANYLSDFLKARQNGFLALNRSGSFNPVYDRTLPGSQPLTVFNTLPGGGFLNNGTVQSLIQSGEPAELGWLYQLNGVAGPLDFFPNPLALSTYYVTNFSNSNYHSLQLEARRRLQHGFEIQGNYVFSKWLSDSAGTDNFRFEPFLDINNAAIGKARVPQDLTHQFKLNYSYQLPLGATRYHKLSRVLGGWMTSGNLIWISGNPLSIYSGRGTFLRQDYSGVNEASTTLTKSQIDSLLGFRMTGNGPYFIAASAINSADGRGVSPDGQPAFNGQVFFNPGPAAIGNLQKREFTGPSVFSMDAAIAKDTKFNERVAAQLRLEALNVFNHPTFAIFAQNINSTQFGKITSNATTPRVLQISLKVTF